MFETQIGAYKPRAFGPWYKCQISTFVLTQMYRMENGTLRMDILKTKGLRPLVQNHFPFATKMPIRNVPFSKIRGILELNQTKSANGQTDRLMRCGLFHLESGREYSSYCNESRMSRWVLLLETDASITGRSQTVVGGT